MMRIAVNELFTATPLRYPVSSVGARNLKVLFDDKKIFDFLETKGSTNLVMDLRNAERLKINCGERHFASLANDIELRSAKTWAEFKVKI